MTSTAEYVLVVYLAEREQSAPVSSGDVADAVGRSPSTTTETLQRLESRGVVTYEPYDGVSLTPTGRERATELYRSYRILSEFFRDVLGIDDYEREARELAGHVSPTVVDRLATTLPLDEDEESHTEGTVHSQ